MKISVELVELVRLDGEGEKKRSQTATASVVSPGVVGR